MGMAPTCHEFVMNPIHLGRAVAQKCQRRPMASRGRFPGRERLNHLLGVEHDPKTAGSARFDMAVRLGAHRELQPELPIEIHSLTHLGNYNTDRIEIWHGGIVPDDAPQEPKQARTNASAG